MKSKTNYINRTLEPPEYMPSKRELEQEDFEERAVNHVITTYSPDEVFDLYLHDKEVAIRFAEWVDLNAVRNGLHEWTVGAGRETKHYTSEQLWEIYITETENKPNK